MFSCFSAYCKNQVKSKSEIKAAFVGLDFVVYRTKSVPNLRERPAYRTKMFRRQKTTKLRMGNCTPRGTQYETCENDQQNSTWRRTKEAKIWATSVKQRSSRTGF